MLVLGIESSCDETAAAVVRNGKEILSSVAHPGFGLMGGEALPRIPALANPEKVLPRSQVSAKDEKKVKIDV